MDKKSARKKGLAARAALTLQQRGIRDQHIFEQVIAMIAPHEVIGCYVSMKDEADTHAILRWCMEKGKTVAVPKVDGNTLTFYAITSFDDLKEGCFGVLEPYQGKIVEPEEIEIMLVPLSSFDDDNYRTGYGKGYYDSILNRCRYKAGIAYDVQKVEQIDCDPWDVRLDEIICGNSE